MKLYVGNLSFTTTENDLHEAFERFGEVSDVAIVQEQGTGRSRGFGFVTMKSSHEAQKAIESLGGSSLDGRNLTVNEARPREDRPGGGSNRSFSRSR